jgi:hypothetical protein
MIFFILLPFFAQNCKNIRPQKIAILPDLLTDYPFFPSGDIDIHTGSTGIGRRSPLL